MVQYIQVYGLIIKDMDKDVKYGRMVKSIKGNGLKIICVVKDKLNGLMVVLILDYLIKMFLMVMVFSNGQVFKNLILDGKTYEGSFK